MKMYNYYSQKLEAFWQRRKWWIIAFGIIVVAIGVTSRIWPKSKAGKISDAIGDFHQNKARIEIISFRPASESTPDSIRLEGLLKIASHYLKQRHDFTNSLSRDTLYADSLEAITSEINAVRAKIGISNSLSFTLCQYVATFSGNEQRSDTLVAVLDEKLNVVWPVKK